MTGAGVKRGLLPRAPIKASPFVGVMIDTEDAEVRTSTGCDQK